MAKYITYLFGTEFKIPGFLKWDHVLWKNHAKHQTPPSWHCSFPTFMKKNTQIKTMQTSCLQTCYYQPTNCHFLLIVDVFFCFIAYPAADFPCHQWWHPTWQFRCLPPFQLPTVCCGLHPIWRRATPSPRWIAMGWWGWLVGCFQDVKMGISSMKTRGESMGSHWKVRIFDFNFCQVAKYILDAAIRFIPMVLESLRFEGEE